MNARPPRSAKVGAGAGLLALVGLVLPQVADAFNPTAIFTALLGLAIGCVIAIGDGVRGLLSHRRTLQDALRLWPPERLGAADLAALGVYPPHEPDGRPRPYVQRPSDEDARLRDALKQSEVVVVHGPPGAGKSRAASEAAKAKYVLGEDAAFVPLDAEALRLIADRSVEISLADSRVCLWLDGLDRFMDALDACAVASLRKLTDTVRVIATIRTEQWNELLQGSGQQSEAARALAGDATVIGLGPLPSDAQPGQRDAPPPKPDSPT